MRKQYHFQPSGAGLKAWDIDRLIELSGGFVPKMVPLSEIREIDEPFWFLDGKTPTCRSVFEHAGLIRDADLSFPIILASDGRVMDGMHRVGKAFLQGEEQIKAVQFTTNPEPDYIGVAPDNLPY